MHNSLKFSIFVESNNKKPIVMPHRKNTIKIDEIGSFFKKSTKEPMKVIYEVIKAIRATDCGLGLAKMGNTKYTVEGKEMTAKQIINATKRKKTSKLLRYKYFAKKVELKGTPVLLLFCKRSRNDNWNVLLTTSLDLNFEQAYKIYATRWSIEVYFKEGKQLLNLGGCQSQAFNAQVAAATIVMLQYGILSVAKRFASYETLGALFRNTEAEVLEITLNERLWVYIC